MVQRLCQTWPVAAMLCAVLAMLPHHDGHAQAAAAEAQRPVESAGVGPVQLRQPAVTARLPAAPVVQSPSEAPTEPSDPVALIPYLPGDFEQFVHASTGSRIMRLGADLVSGPSGAAPEFNVAAPGEYVIAPGDEVIVQIWGSVDADLRATVDRSGRINLPRIGTVQVAGVSNADLQSTVRRAVERVFRNFELSVSLGQLRGIRVFVSGFVARPGTYTVNPLASVVSVLMRAGGPSAAGSFRQVELKRGGRVVGSFDLYDLMLRGDRSTDRLVQAGDVVHVAPVGTQVAVVGSVNRPAVVELRAGEKVADALAMAGGFTAIADRGRLAIERLSERINQRIAELAMPQDGAASLNNGDVLRAFSATSAILSTQRQNKRVTIGGEVLRPGEYVLPPDSTIQDAIRMAGGIGQSAFVFGTQFFRESVRQTQQENYDRALRDLETDIAKASGSLRLSSSEEANAQRAQMDSRTRLIQRLRELRPNGRVVLQIRPSDSELPALVLEDQDRLYIPPRPTTIGIFGSVFNSGSYLYGGDRSMQQYLQLAGGPTRGADASSMFVVRANGQVVSALQGSARGWMSRNEPLEGVMAEPGDTLFVPEEMDKTTFVQAAKDWTQIFYQFGIGIAGIKSALQ